MPFENKLIVERIIKKNCLYANVFLIKSPIFIGLFIDFTLYVANNGDINP